MPASEHINKTLFHGSHNPNWTQNPDWVHLGDRQAAETRLKEGFYPGQKDTEGDIYKVYLHPEATVYPKTIGTRDIEEDWRDDDGNYYTKPRTHDLGMLLDGGYVNMSHPAYSHPSGKPYDVYPYENIVEGGTSYLVNPNVIKRTRKVK